MTAATYERMDIVVRYIRKMNADLGGRIDGLGEKVDSMNVELGGKIDGVGRKVDSMNVNLCGKIDGLSGKVSAMKANLGSKMDSVGSEVKLMRTEMNRNFTIMADRYDKISQAMFGILEEFRQDRKESREFMKNVLTSMKRKSN